MGLGADWALVDGKQKQTAEVSYFLRLKKVQEDHPRLKRCGAPRATRDEDGECKDSFDQVLRDIGCLSLVVVVYWLLSLIVVVYYFECAFSTQCLEIVCRDLGIIK